MRKDVMTLERNHELIENISKILGGSKHNDVQDSLNKICSRQWYSEKKRKDCKSHLENLAVAIRHLKGPAQSKEQFDLTTIAFESDRNNQIIDIGKKHNDNIYLFGTSKTDQNPTFLGEEFEWVGQDIQKQFKFNRKHEAIPGWGYPYIYDLIKSGIRPDKYILFVPRQAYGLDNTNLFEHEKKNIQKDIKTGALAIYQGMVTTANVVKSLTNSGKNLTLSAGTAMSDFSRSSFENVKTNLSPPSNTRDNQLDDPILTAQFNGINPMNKRYYYIHIARWK
ncbi:MAG: hypothetical protein GY705_31780 [Bacteroidetes bacterium]|nr:hypothetical protein [Bacteroidota bacterium]